MPRRIQRKKAPCGASFASLKQRPYFGCDTTRRYGFSVLKPCGYFFFASSSETDAGMMTSSPGFQFTGVATVCFALKLAHKDVTLAIELARSVGVPMQAGEHALAELSAAMKRGWADRDCRVAMTLQEERAGVSVRVPPEKLKDVT